MTVLDRHGGLTPAEPAAQPTGHDRRHGAWHGALDHGTTGLR